MSKPLVGTSVLRKEAHGKLTGRATYVDDVDKPGMLHGATIRTKGPRGRVRGVRFEGDLPWHEFTIVTAKDIPGKNVVALINDDQPCLVDGTFSHPEEAVVLIAHPDKHLVAKARKHVIVEEEALPAVLTIEEALAAKTVVWGEDNVFKRYSIEKGDVDAATKGAARVTKGTYVTGAQEQLYIETNGMIAEFEADGTLVVSGSLQCPYYVQKALMSVFGLPPEKTRIVQLETGGGFGGKEEYPSMIGAHAALLAHAAKRPVKIVYDRTEDMAATTKRHPSRTTIVSAVDADGKLLALDIGFDIDGGAYSTLSQVVLSRGTIHAAGPYATPNVRVRSRAVATNSPPHGAFRGFGAPQSIFALERHLDRVAKEIGISPVEIRRRNFVKKGGSLSTGQLVRDDIDMNALMDKALRAASYDEKRSRYAKDPADAPSKRGVGVACFLHGTGFTGSGEKYLASVVGAEATPEGHVRILAASTEIGQGTNTIFTQMAADTLGVDASVVEVARPDTAHVPNSGPTVASRTCTIVGKLVGDAALALKRELEKAEYLPATYDTETFRAACARYVKEKGELRTKVTYEQPPFIQWDETTFRGDAYGSYSWAVYVADVDVDMTTYAATVKDFVALQEVGKVINPTLAAGQIEGGVAQAIGFALYENVAWKEGRMENARMTDYIMPTSADLPTIRVFFEEAPYPYGGFGAKGIGELPMDGPAPAILNGIADATGVDLFAIPATPETIFRAMEASHG